jgi:hypothetical protein
MLWGGGRVKHAGMGGGPDMQLGGKRGPDITSWERGIRPGPRTGGPRGTKHYVMERGYQTRSEDWRTAVRENGDHTLRQGKGVPNQSGDRGTRHYVMVKGYQTDPETGGPAARKKGGPDFTSGKGGYQNSPGTGGPDITSCLRGTRPIRGLGDQGGPDITSWKRGTRPYVRGKGY